MFLKLLSFIIVYALSIVNFAIILLPLLFLLIPAIITETNVIEEDSIISVMIFVLFCTSLIMNFMILIDFIFSISYKKFIKNTKNYEEIEDYKFLMVPFEEIKVAFNKPNVKLLISESTEVNAFAVGNMRNQYIVLTKGLIAKYIESLTLKSDFLLAMKCILGHEMSHLANRDYLPTLLLEINKNSSEFVSKIILKIFTIFTTIIKVVPIIGSLISNVIMFIYKTLNYIILFFYKYVVLHISRGKEFRCDYQSAIVSGGINVSTALSILGEDGYSTIFSSHPNTNRRIRKVREVGQLVSSNMKYFLVSDIINLIGFLVVFTAPFVLFFLINFQEAKNEYKSFKSRINTKIIMLKINLNMVVE